jgi:hypothetical protein
MPRQRYTRPGRKFNRLEVVELIKEIPGKRPKRFWRCRCKCGTVVAVSEHHLITNHTQSCGCLRKERTIAKIKTHGESASARTLEYSTWASMIQRCRNSESHKFPRYGGRGIAVCERWNSFINFLADMGRKPSPQHSIERRNNDGNYEPSNCYWATHKEQSRNKITTRFITFNGTTKCVTDWAALLGMRPNTLSGRLSRWTVEKSLRTPVGKHTRR